jgi:copper(I)-binding protein
VNLRRTLALGAVGLMASGILGACGFSYATDRINSITAAANYRDGTVDVLNAAIVSKVPDSGTFVAGFANNDQTRTITLTDISGDVTTVADVTTSPIPIDANKYVNLATKGAGVPVNGTFTAGQYVSLTLTFDDGESATLNVPVFEDSGQWAGLDHSTPSPSASATPSS